MESGFRFRWRGSEMLGARDRPEQGAANDTVSAGPNAIVSSMSDAPVIHIIDDDESMSAALGSLLRSVALATRLYSSVDAFLKAPRPDLPGCLILDVRLPGISGLEFQAQLAQMGIRLPVILMTGHGDVPMSVRGMKAGAVDFLMKPFRLQKLFTQCGSTCTEFIYSLRLKQVARLLERRKLLCTGEPIAPSLTPAAFATTRISHENFAVGSVTRRTPTPGRRFALETAQCTRVPI